MASMMGVLVLLATVQVAGRLAVQWHAVRSLERLAGGGQADHLLEVLRILRSSSAAPQGCASSVACRCCSTTLVNDSDPSVS